MLRKEIKFMAYDAVKEASNWYTRMSGKSAGSSEYDDFVKKMQDLMDKPYESYVPEKPDKPEYGQMQMDDRTNDELSDLAKAMLEEYRQQNQKAIENAKNSETAALNKDKETADRLAKERQDEIEQGFGQAQSGLNDELLKRGLARSSIAANTNTKLQESKANAINDTQKQYAQTLADIESKLSNLDAQRQQALDQFDISFAAKLTTTINDLIKERDKANADAMKFNNDVLQQQQNDYANSLNNAGKEIELNETAKQAQLEERQKELYSAARQVLSTMSSKEAKEKLQNDPIFRNLPQYMHTALFREFVK